MRDSRRRNRNIGTAKSGHGQNNTHTIPDRWENGSVYWERLTSPVIVEKHCHGSKFTFIIEPTLADCFHACTVEDVRAILELLPIEHTEQIDLIVFRQPTRRQQLLNTVWGRLAYWSDVAGMSGPGIFLEAQQLPMSLTWPLSLSPDRKLELDRLEEDGHHIERTKRSYLINSTLNNIRSTQLFRTFPHEVGHYVDFLQTSAPYEANQNYDDFWALYDAKPSHDKEAFAHRYADEFGRQWRDTGQLPFRQIVDLDAMQRNKLDPAWFGLRSDQD